MVRSPLYDTLAASSARMSEYLGVPTAAEFGDPAAEFEQLRGGVGLYDLAWRGKIVLTGGDRVRWMNGMVTNNIKDLPPGAGNYNFLLNAQGRIQADLYVYNRGEYLLADSDRAQVPRLLEIFDKYIIADDVEVADASDKLTGIAVQGPQAREVLTSAGLPCADPQPLQVVDATWQGFGVSITRMASEVAETFEIWLAPANAQAAWKALSAAGANPVGTEAVEMFRVAAGIPRYGLDIRERDLPQETEQNQALNYRKGCYIGQEIVERIHSRGAVHRKFTGFVVEGAQPQPGTKIVAGEKEIGEITSALPVGRQVLALGYIRREAATPGAEVQVNGSRARVATLPFKEIG